MSDRDTSSQQIAHIDVTDEPHRQSVQKQCYLSYAALVHIYMFLSPHGSDRSKLVAANPSLQAFNLRFLISNANQIGSWWTSVRAFPDRARDQSVSDVEHRGRRDVSAYPRAHILRAISANLHRDLIRAFPEFLVMLVYSNRFYISDSERAAIRRVQSEFTPVFANRSPSTILARLAVEPSMSNRVISNAAMLAARVGRLRLEQINNF